METQERDEGAKPEGKGEQQTAPTRPQRRRDERPARGERGRAKRRERGHGRQRDRGHRTAVAVAEREAEEEAEVRLRSYELIYLVDASLAREEIDHIAASLIDQIEQSGGYADNVRVSEVRKLEYPVKKRTHGIYVLINFHAEPTVVGVLDGLLKFNEQVLRYMIIRLK